MGHTRLGLGVIGLGVAYWALAEVGGALSYPGGVQVAWLPAGFAAVVLCLGDMRWAIGAAVADLLLGTGVAPIQANLLLHDPTVLYQSLGNTVEFVLAAYLMRVWLGRECRFERPSDVGRLLLVFAVAEPISAALGTLSSWQAGYIALGQAATFFRTWLLADAAGATLLVPLILVWRRPWPGRPSTRAAIEAVLIMGAVAALSVAGFGSAHPIAYIVFPALVVAAVRLGQRGATVALLLAFAIAIAMTSRNIGPFVTRSIDDEVLTTQLYMLVATLTALTLGAAISDRQRAAMALAESRRRESERAAEERQRIARDLHDSVSQTLYSLGLHAGIAQHEIAHGAANDDGRLSAAVQEVAGLAQGALLEMRASIFELRGGAVAEQGLVAALAAHCIAQSLRHDVHIDVTGPPERLPLDVPVEELLFRIGQEAITNAVKHSASEIVSVQVTEGQGRVTLEVRDDGVGFDPERAYAGHLGLDLLRTRAADAGGSATIGSRPGEGTSVVVSVPVPLNAAADRDPL
jgi:signal transduction histidine kinase